MLQTYVNHARGHSRLYFCFGPRDHVHVGAGDRGWEFSLQLSIQWDTKLKLKQETKSFGISSHCTCNLISYCIKLRESINTMCVILFCNS